MTSTSLDPGSARAALAPDPELEARIRTFLRAQLGKVLPPDPARGLDWYYDWVVLGRRSLEALTILEQHGAGTTDRPVLDVGSGLGTSVLLACRMGMDAVGIEPGVDELVLARERQARMPELAGRTLFSEGTGEQLPFPDGTFGAVLLHDVLEHVSDWRAVLREVRRVLAPGGVAYVKGPSYAVRFVEPHYRVLWLPLFPKPLARIYLQARDRDVEYLSHLGWRRRGEVLAALETLGFELEFPRRRKLADPSSINRRWIRPFAASLGPGRPLGAVGRLLADNPLQSTMDVVARVPT